MRTKLDPRYDQPAESICEDMTTIGKVIRLRRKELGLSQTQLAQAVPCTQKLVSEVERGKCTVAAGTVLRMTSCLGIDVITRVRGK